VACAAVIVPILAARITPTKEVRHDVMPIAYRSKNSISFGRHHATAGGND